MIKNKAHVKPFTSGMRISILLVVTVMFSIMVPKVWADVKPNKEEIGIDEKIGQMIPLDIPFVDEEGKPVILKDLVGDKPFILSLNYYHCPGICDQQMSGIAEVLDSVQLEPGKDFKVITISFDPVDNPALALEKKSTFYTSMKRKLPDNGWYFLTGTPENIKRITDAVGFRYKKVEGGYYLHSGALTAISPKGKIARYIYGLTYLPFDLQMAMTEASQGKSGPTMNKLLLYCFSYEPQGRRYAFNIIRISGISTMLFGLAFLSILIVKSKKARKEKEENHNG